MGDKPVVYHAFGVVSLPEPVPRAARQSLALHGAFWLCNALFHKLQITGFPAGKGG